jgi:hypothetical protein
MQPRAKSSWRTWPNGWVPVSPALRSSPPSSERSTAWRNPKEKAHFSASFKEYLALFGAAPREDYLALVKKVEELKERVESQDETIRHLRILLAEAKKEEYRSVAGHFEDLVQKQAEQFQNLMDSLGQVFKKGDSRHDG